MLLLTAEAMRALDRATIEAGHARGIDLMLRAGAGVATAIERRYGSLLGLRSLVLCGTGNNGGDGFVAAAHLARRGAQVQVAIAGERARKAGDAAQALASLEAGGIEAASAPDEHALRAIVSRFDRWDLAVDALLGTGARGEPQGVVAAAVRLLCDVAGAGTRTVAVDLPTGVDADTGEVRGPAVPADLTVTFGAPKRGHLLWPGRGFVGALEVVDIGLVSGDPESQDYRVRVSTGAELSRFVPRRDPRAHKGTSGRVLVIGGSAGLTGAVALAAHAATRAGAGYVQVAVPSSLESTLAAKLTEEMAIGCPETAERAFAPATIERLEPYVARAHALAIGSGLGRHPESLAVARRLAIECPRPAVLDADGLNAFAGRAGELSRAAGPRVLTPHVGEMSRLTGETAEALERRRIDAPREWAARWNAVVVFKGAPTVTAAPDGRVWVNGTGGPALATAGTGDVLTGIVVALLGQGVAPFEAGALAAHVHGAAGDAIGERRGVLGMAASDLHDELPRVLGVLARLRDAGTRGS